MTFTIKRYSAGYIATLPNGLVDYEVSSATEKDAKKVAVTCLFRYEIGKPDKDGIVTCTECTETYNRVRSQIMAQTGDMRVTKAAKDEFKADLAKYHSAYGVLLAHKIEDDAEIAIIEEDLKGAVNDEFSEVG